MNNRAEEHMRRWWRTRFGLRTFFFLVTVLGVGLGYLGIVQQRVQRQRRIVKAIEKIGGKVTYDYEISTWAFRQDPFQELTQLWSHERMKDGRNKVTRTTVDGEKIEYMETPTGPKFVRRLLGDDVFSKVESVSFSREADPRREFDPQLVLGLPQVSSVSLAGPSVSGEWIRTIARAPHLESLDLTGLKESTAAADELASLRLATDLHSLMLSGDWVNDTAMQHLSPLKSLQELWLGQTSELSATEFSHIGELAELRKFTVMRAGGLMTRERRRWDD